MAVFSSVILYGCFWNTIPFKYPRREYLQRFKSGEVGGHKSWVRTLSSKTSGRKWNMLLLVWGMAPSCGNQA
jgi:hypothetical protein